MSQAVEGNDQILDLGALAPEREEVRLVKDGPTYEMLSPEEIGIQDRAKMMKIFERIQKLSEKKKPSPADTKKMEKDMRELMRMTVPKAPAAQIAKLKYHQLDVFTGRFLVAFGNMISQVAKAIGSETVMELIEGSQQTSAK